MTIGKLLPCFTALVIGVISARAGDVSTPDSSQTNHFYTGDRAPLRPSVFLPLPTGAIEPRGWLRVMLERERDGLAGHLGEISVWLQKEDNAWLSRDGQGKHGWEELPYWLRGYLELAYIFNDPKMISESQVWMEGVLASQRTDGDFGPDQRFDDGTRDYWANMIMLFCLESYYEHAGDKRVLDLMTKYFQYQLALPDEKLLTHYWQKMRGGDELFSIYWLYNRTGEAFLLQLADKIHRRTADWEMTGTLPDWHNVNIAEGFREPAEHFLQTRAEGELAQAYANFHEVRKRFGQVPGGMFGGDENCRPGHSDPRQAVETCGMVEQMFSDEILQQVSGDVFWADNCEDVAFNSYPAALTPDMRALRYLTAPNMAVSDARDHSPGLQNSGPFLMMNPFSSRCCQHNHSMGWPYFAKHLWLATPDNGLCAAIFSASKVTAKVGGNSTVRIEEESHYPFEDKIRFVLQTEKPVLFPLYLRIPGWCKTARVLINGKKLASPTGAGHYACINHKWENGDVVTLDLPMAISVRTWAANHNSVSVDYGPLTFSLAIGQEVVRVDSTKTAIGDSGWQKTADPAKWPAFEYYPATPWNYGLALDSSHPEKSLTITKLPWPGDDYPFSPESTPLKIWVKARQIPEWTLDQYGLCAVLQESPVYSTSPLKKVSLIPMGAARLRISAFPCVTDDSNANHWRKPQ